MDVDNYPDLADLLLGRGTAERSRAPEPTLLPHLAPFVGRDDLEELCRSAQLYAEGNSGPPPWPDLRQAVFQSVAVRLGEDSESGRLLEQFPALGSCLSERHLALVDLALRSGDGSVEPCRTSRPAGGPLSPPCEWRPPVRSARGGRVLR